MSWRRGLKITGIVLGLLLVFIGGAFAYLYYDYFGKFPVDETKYTNNIGYIDTEQALLTENFTLCVGNNSEPILLGFYSSSDPSIFRGTKYTFRKFITESYKNEGLSETGFLNFRFHINCHGETGNLVVNEIDSEYKETAFDPKLVAQLTTLTMRNENWQVRAELDSTASHYNHYMYIIYKLENGAITEILP